MKQNQPCRKRWTGALGRSVNVTHVFLSLLLVELCLLAAPFPVAGAEPESELQTLGKLLSKGLEMEREEPFRVRELKPWLDKQWLGKAVSYGPFREGQAPWGVFPGRTEILEDLELLLRHWNLIRVYNADEGSELILDVIQQHKLPVRVMLGVWLEGEEDRPEMQQRNRLNLLKAVELAVSYPEIVWAINVGNETQVEWSGHRMNVQSLIQYIRVLRSACSQPVTTADDYNFWNKPESRAVAAEVDFITVHAHPLWNGLQVETSTQWLDETLNEVRELHPDHELVLGETGWATDYNPDKTGPGQQGTLIKGEASESAQSRFLQQMDTWIQETGSICFLFEAFDESWKGGGASSGPREVEKHWGMYCENRKPKQFIREELKPTKSTLEEQKQDGE